MTAARSSKKFGFENRLACPICRSSNLTSLFSAPFAEGAVGRFIARHYKADPAALSAAPYELVRCKDCSLTYQKWIGDAQLLAELYGKWIADHMPPERDSNYLDLVAHPRQSRDGHEIFVAAQVMGTSPEAMTTLDYGMGWGLWARIAKQLGCHSFGTELAADRVEFARRHGIEVVGDEDLGESKFDFINTEQVFEHLVDPREAAERLSKSLKPGGILKISVPSAANADAIISRLKANRLSGDLEEIMPIQPLEHINSYTPATLHKLADILRLEPARPGLFQQYGFLKWPGAIDTARPRQALKELVRPIYRTIDRSNLYLWLRKPISSRQRAPA